MSRRLIESLSSSVGKLCNDAYWFLRKFKLGCRDEECEAGNAICRPSIYRRVVKEITASDRARENYQALTLILNLTKTEG
jgi:hypothetical protein